MWTLLITMACSDPVPTGLAPDAIVAKRGLAHALEMRVPADVQAKARAAAEWEGQDAELDWMLGDALANVLMQPSEGLALLRTHPELNAPDRTQALLLATFRHGDLASMTQAWTAAGRSPPAFDNPVTTAMVQRAHADPQTTIEQIESGINGCAFLDAQPPVGRTALDYPAGPGLLQTAEWLGADVTVIGRPRVLADADPHQGRGPLHCERKVLIDSWPHPFSKTLTLGLSQGHRKVFIDIKITDGEPWVFATSDSLAGGRWLSAYAKMDSPNAEETIKAMFPSGLWATEEADTP